MTTTDAEATNVAVRTLHGLPAVSAGNVDIDRQLLLEVFKHALKDHDRHHCWDKHCTGRHIPCEDECFCHEESRIGDYGPYGRVPVGPETIQLVSVELPEGVDTDRYGHDRLVTVRYTGGTGHDHHALYGVSTTTNDISLYAD